MVKNFDGLVATQNMFGGENIDRFGNCTKEIKRLVDKTLANCHQTFNCTVYS